MVYSDYSNTENIVPDLECDLCPDPVCLGEPVVYTAYKDVGTGKRIIVLVHKRCYADWLKCMNIEDEDG